MSVNWLSVFFYRKMQIHEIRFNNKENITHFAREVVDLHYVDSHIDYMNIDQVPEKYLRPP